MAGVRIRKRYIALAVLIIIACGIWIVIAGLRAVNHAMRWGNAQAIHFAAYEGNVAKLNELIADGADVEAKATAPKWPWMDVTPLHMAAEQNQAGCITVLLAAGAGVDTPDKLGRSPLYAAVEHCSEQAACELLAAGAKPAGVAGEHDWAGAYTPFELTLSTGSIDLVNEFLKHGTVADMGGEAPIAAVDGPDRLAKLELLLPVTANVDAARPDRQTALANAAMAGDVESIRLLLDHGADLDLPSGSYELTPVFWAAYMDRTDAMCELLGHGADPHQGTRDFATLIYIASFNGHTETVRKLLDLGLDIRLDIGRMSDGATPLHLAYWNNNQELVQLLLNAGADPDIPTTDGRRPREYRR